ncbi:MAG TPA: VOC family protein [Mycobacteriales bacterium]|nr:VOC family protein [Mycobacteriales bacterium]
MVAADYLFAGVVVCEIDAATEWYTRFFGREPSFRPNDYESVWQTVATGSVYIKADPPNAGRSVVTFAVANLEAEVAALTERGITAAPVEKVGTVGIKSKLNDPDGNEITLVEIRAGQA